uniref:Uncharacterized protein n=1 Tax=Ciona savignyi TaxID=51511 RepID=H2Y693_CIOSA
MPANRSITTVQNKTVQSNPYSGLWSMCNTMKMLNMVQRDLIKVCSFAEMYGPNGFSLPSSQDIEQVLSGSNDLNAVGTSTNPVGSVQFARNLLGLATGTATKN